MVRHKGMYFSYADINMAKYDYLVNKFHIRPSIWKRFRNDGFVLLEHRIVSVPLFLEYLNSLDKTCKINVTMEIAKETGLEVLDLKLEIVEGKIREDIIFVKPTNSYPTNS